MIDWAARARVALAQPLRVGAVKTDETPLLSVSSVPPAANGGNFNAVSSSSLNPYMTAVQGNDCHACGWDDAEIAAFLSRSMRFAQIGRRDAEHLAERLALRDRQLDDRQMCVECRELEPSGRCIAARRGAFPGADRNLVPVQNVLWRCTSFRHASGAGGTDLG